MLGVREITPLGRQVLSVNWRARTSEGYPFTLCQNLPILLATHDNSASAAT